MRRHVGHLHIHLHAHATNVEVPYGTVRTSLQNSSFKKRTSFVSRASLARIGYIGHPTAGVTIVTSDTCIGWTRVRRGGPEAICPMAMLRSARSCLGERQEQTYETTFLYPPYLHRFTKSYSSSLCENGRAVQQWRGWWRDFARHICASKSSAPTRTWILR
jgi:hypothetical protein